MDISIDIRWNINTDDIRWILIRKFNSN